MGSVTFPIIASSCLTSQPTSVRYSVFLWTPVSPSGPWRWSQENLGSRRWLSSQLVPHSHANTECGQIARRHHTQSGYSRMTSRVASRVKDKVADSTAHSMVSGTRRRLISCPQPRGFPRDSMAGSSAGRILQQGLLQASTAISSANTGTFLNLTKPQFRLPNRGANNTSVSVTTRQTLHTE